MQDYKKLSMGTVQNMGLIETVMQNTMNMQCQSSNTFGNFKGYEVK